MEHKTADSSNKDYIVAHMSKIADENIHTVVISAVV